MSKRKPFSETKVGQFLKEKAPDLLDKIGDYFPPVEILADLVKGKSLTPEQQAEFDKLLFDYAKLEVEDRQSARTREIEIAKAGGNDHLMYVAGYVALAAFLTMIAAVIFLPEAVEHNSLFHQLMGIIEGVALTVFSYYFGTSKSSRDKDKLIGK
jgi:hypothetical protein